MRRILLIALVLLLTTATLAQASLSRRKDAWNKFGDNQSTGDLSLRGNLSASDVVLVSGAKLSTAVQEASASNWDKSASDDITIGTTSTTAGRGDLVSTAYSHATGVAAIGHIPTAVVTNSDTTHVPTSDNVYDFVTGLGYITSADDTVSGTELDGVFASGTGLLKRTGTGTYSVDGATYLTAEVDGSTTNEIEVVDEAYNATNFNGGTASAVSQDDLYDLLHLADTDDDGYVNKVDLTAGFVKTDADGTLSADTNTYLTSASFDTSAEIRAILTDETGTGAAVFADNPVLPSGLTVDTNTFVVDSVNNRVGIGTAEPDSILEINRNGGSTTAVAPVYGNNLVLSNDTAVSAATIQAPPALIFSGHGWTGSGDQITEHALSSDPMTNGNPTFRLLMREGGTGGWTTIWNIDSSGRHEFTEGWYDYGSRETFSINATYGAGEAATDSYDQYSYSHLFSGAGWKTNATAGSQTMSLRYGLCPEQGASSPTGVFKYMFGTNTATPTESNELYRLKWGSDVGSLGVVFNELSLDDYDFRVEGNTDANLFVTDGSTDRVGIGTIAPSAKLDIMGDLSVSNGLTVVGTARVTGNAVVTDTVYSGKFSDQGNSNFYVDPAHETLSAVLNGDVTINKNLSVATINGKTPLSKEDIDTEAEFEALLFTLPEGGASGNFTGLLLGADSGTDESLTNSDEIHITGGTNIGTVVASTDTVTVNLDPDIHITGSLEADGDVTCSILNCDSIAFSGQQDFLGVGVITVEDVTVSNGLFVGTSLISPTLISNWSTAYGWGNHASAGYLVSANMNSLAEFDTQIGLTGTPSSSTFICGDGSWGTPVVPETYAELTVTTALNVTGYIKSDTDIYDIPLSFNLSMSNGLGTTQDFLFAVKTPFAINVETAQLMLDLSPSAGLTVSLVEQVTGVATIAVNQNNKFGSATAVNNLFESGNLIGVKLTGVDIGTDLSNVGVLRLVYERRSET